MTKPRLLLTLLSALALTIPATASAQTTADPSSPPVPTAEAMTAEADTRLAELRALVPEQLAGLPLREDLQVATGEQLAGQMSEAEHERFKALLAANGKDIGDYAAANVLVRLGDDDALVVQPHRVTGIDAGSTVDAWLEILELNAAQPEITSATIAGRPVRRFSDAAQPDVPALHVFASGDVVWMVVAKDAGLVEEAVRVLAQADAASGEPPPSE